MASDEPSESNHHVVNVLDTDVESAGEQTGPVNMVELEGGDTVKIEDLVDMDSEGHRYHFLVACGLVAVAAVVGVVCNGVW
eukprot:CAMPEP_0194052268 /NCGR_PEP_ID=MMETSP0009_2-20130614/44713_1 /TAXON_ID=210454 /ORGANISM="Grammatophora oceanica, Strain CCMP 410" /LENGTH=80 /DNA_ID=CAMNT_0038699779 /DNA_START=88 /DNA_END=327 /DNA_ORIENTATION=+